MASISKSSRRDPENVSTLLFSATPVSLVVVMMAAEVCWGFRIELPHLCAIALRRPSARLCEQVGGSKRTCSDPASSRTQTGPASVRRGGTIWVEGISDRQMMAVGRAMIFPATSSCSRSCSGGPARVVGTASTTGGGTADCSPHSNRDRVRRGRRAGRLEGPRPANAQSLG